MPKVFIVQEPLKRNHRSGEMESFMDLTPASAYGELVVLLGRGAAGTLTPGPMIHQLKRKLSSYTDEDYLLLVGDTGAIAAAAAIASSITGGTFNILKWNRQTKQYLKVRMEV
jgi:hypothetical protein